MRLDAIQKANIKERAAELEREGIESRGIIERAYQQSKDSGHSTSSTPRWLISDPRMSREMQAASDVQSIPKVVQNYQSIQPIKSTLSSVTSAILHTPLPLSSSTHTSMISDETIDTVKIYHIYHVHYLIVLIGL